MTDLHGLLADTAATYAANGLSIVPARADGSKSPFGRWRDYWITPATERTLRNWFATGQYDGMGIICGAISGNLELLELEGRAVLEGYGQRLRDQLNARQAGDLLDRLTNGHLEITPSGGWHWLYRVTGIAVPGNTKLAQRPATELEVEQWRNRQHTETDTETDPAVRSKRRAAIDRITDGSQLPQTLIETRGEHGFTVCAPSAGRTHPSGRAWLLAAGGPDTIPTITAEERQILHDACRALDTMPTRETQWDTANFSSTSSSAPRLPTGGATSSATPTGASGRPGDDYNTRATWADILQPHGWRPTGRGTNGETVWTRPDKRDGTSATTGYSDDGIDRLYVFSTSTLFEAEQPYTKFAAFALLEFGGDHAAAARALRAEGYGDNTTPARESAFVGLIDTKDTTWRDSPAAATSTQPPRTDPTTRAPATATGGAAPELSSAAPATSTGMSSQNTGPTANRTRVDTWTTTAPTTPATTASPTTSSHAAPTSSAHTPTPSHTSGPALTAPIGAATTSPTGSTDPWPTPTTTSTTENAASSPSSAATAPAPSTTAPPTTTSSPTASSTTDADTSQASTTNSTAASTSTTESNSSTATASATGPSNPPADDDHPERTSWWPKNLAATLAGHDDEPPPAHLARQDGHRLLYAGKVNGLIGESESGKTFVALLAVLQTLQIGEPAVILDFEDTAPGIIRRLRDMGATDTHLQHLAYIGPDEALHATASSDLSEALTDIKPAVILLDGVNAAMTLLGLELESNGDATKFSQLLLKPMSRTGACVITVDHVPKNSEQRGKGGIGAQAKRAMMTGCTLRVEVLEEFGRGMTGRLKLTVDKDRPGHVRAVSADAKNAGTFIIASNKDGNIKAHIDPPDMRPQSDIKKERDDARFSTLMEACSRELENARASGVDDGEMTQRALEVAVALRIEGGARADDVREAARRLVSVSCAAVRPGGRNALLYRSTKPYRQRPEGLDDAFRGLL